MARRRAPLRPSTPSPPLITDTHGQGLIFADPALQPVERRITVAKDTDDSGLEALADRALLRYTAKICRVIEQIEEVGLPAPGQQLRLITRRTFNAVAFLQYIVARDPIEDLRLVVYSINRCAALLLAGMLDSGKIRRAEILISNLRNTAADEKEKLTRELFASRPSVTLFYASSHAKLMSCRTASGQFYTVEGSANLSFNSRIENYVIDNDRALFDFTASWMTEIRDFLRDRPEFEQVGHAALAPSEPSEQFAPDD